MLPMNTIALLTTLFAGFSIFSAAILLFSYCFFLKEMRKTLSAKVWCALMMIGLCILQGFHIAYFTYQHQVMEHAAYAWVLLLMPICFFFFSRSVIFIDLPHKPSDLLHFLPILIGFLMPTKIMPIFAFFVGSAYTLWFASTVIKLRDHRSRFRFEVFFFSLFAAMAVAALFLVATLPFVSAELFFSVYANAISLSFALVVTALLIFPELLSDISEIAENAYAKSHLGGLNLAELQRRLEDLMVVDKHYTDEDLNLATLAKELDLSLHQLSELINTQYGFGFKRFLKEHRLRAAKTLLLSQPKSSILAISMETGFRSQSAFYAAFKEIEGLSPGKYRQKNLS